MSTHTPGPWENHGRTVYAGKSIVSLAVAEYDAERGPQYNLADHLKSDDEGLANARLIAAAPELLEACEAVLKWAATPGNHGGNPYLQPMVKAAEIALAKAQGGGQ